MNEQPKHFQNTTLARSLMLLFSCQEKKGIQKSWVNAQCVWGPTWVKDVYTTIFILFRPRDPAPLCQPAASAGGRANIFPSQWKTLQIPGTTSHRQTRFPLPCSCHWPRVMWQDRCGLKIGKHVLQVGLSIKWAYCIVLQGQNTMVCLKINQIV